MPKKKKVDALVEAPGGELVFRPVEASKKQLKKEIGSTKNPVLKRNVFKQGSNEKEKV